MPGSNDQPAAASANASSKKARSKSCEPSEEKESDKRSRTGGSLAESALGLLGHLDQSTRLDAEIDWWSQWDPRLVSAWLRDYKEVTDEEVKDHKAILNQLALLVIGKLADRPSGATKKDQLAALRENLMHRVEQYPDVDKSALPGYRSTRPALPESLNDHLGDSSSGEDDDEDAPPAPASSQPSPAPPVSSPAQKVWRQPSFGSPSSVPPPVAAPVSSPAYGSSPQDADCPHCLAPRPMHVFSMRFACTECARRSDVAIDHPINMELRRAYEKTLELAASHGLAATPIGSSSGQSKGDSITPRAVMAAASAHDRMCEIELARGGDFPLFVGPQAGASLTHDVALERARLALYGQMYERPSAKLIELVRAGKLHHVGWTVPRRIELGVSSMDISNRVDVVDGQLVLASAQSKGLQAACSSVQQFASAMFSTIIPSLIDRPAALMQWVVLARTALELEVQDGWPAASSYIAQLLQERITQHQPFDAVSQQALSSIAHLRATVRIGTSLDHPPAGGRPAGSSAAVDVSRQACDRHNAGTCTNPCPSGRRHVCGRCYKPDHVRSACPSVRPPGSGGSNRDRRDWDRDRRSNKPEKKSESKPPAAASAQ